MTARAQATAATHERLLSAAWELFSSRPYESVRLQEIAARAGVSAQTLHTHFGSKDALLSEAYAWWGAQVIADRQRARPGELTHAIEILFDAYEAHGEAVLRMLAQEERVPAIRQMTDAGRVYHRQWCERVFAALLCDLRGAARRRRLAAIVAACDLSVWKLLRKDMGLERGEAQRVVIAMATGGAQL